MKMKDSYGYEIPFNEVLSKAAVVQLIEHLKCTKFSPKFAHLDAHNALNAALSDILNTEGVKLNAAEEAKNKAIAEKLIEENNLKKSRSRRNINAMAEKFMVMIAQTLKEEYHWSNCRINHFLISSRQWSAAGTTMFREVRNRMSSTRYLWQRNSSASMILRLTRCSRKQGTILTEKRQLMEKINIPHKICAYAKTDGNGADDKAQPNWSAWTSERIAEWWKVTGKLRPIINNLDYEIYLCCYSCKKGHMTTKPEREVKK